MSSQAKCAPYTAILSLRSVALSGKVGKYAMQAYKQWNENNQAPTVKLATGDGGEPINNNSTDSTTIRDDIDTSKKYK